MWYLYISWYDIIRGAPQDSIVRPLLFNILVNNLFSVILISEVCNFADDKTQVISKKRENNAFDLVKD